MGVAYIWLHPLSFWEPEMVSGLLDDEAATNMLYIEILDHISNGINISFSCLPMYGPGWCMTLVSNM